jgi:uncharacterized membrane protein YhhN
MAEKTRPSRDRRWPVAAGLFLSILGIELTGIVLHVKWEAFDEPGWVIGLIGFLLSHPLALVCLLLARTGRRRTASILFLLCVLLQWVILVASIAGDLSLSGGHVV